MIKKFTLSLVTGCSLLLSGLSSEAAVLSGTITTPAGALTGTTNVVLITTNRVNVYQIQLSSSANGIISFYDCDTTNGPSFGLFYTNQSWVTRASFASNVVTSFVGQNGVTNWFTNSVQFSQFVTNANGTNAFNPLVAAAFGANLPTVLNVDALFERGITVNTSTNVNYVIYYNSGQ